MQSNVASVAPASAGTQTNYASSSPENIVVSVRDNYLPEIAVITVAICMIMVIFLILFPKKHSSE
jgi:hypothetical protein